MKTPEETNKIITEWNTNNPNFQVPLKKKPAYHRGKYKILDRKNKHIVTYVSDQYIIMVNELSARYKTTPQRVMRSLISQAYCDEIKLKKIIKK